MEKKYCSECGKEMLVSEIGAETEVLHHYGIDSFKSRISSPYDSKTGKRQTVKKYQCPSWEDKWLRQSMHDCYVDENNIIIN